MTPSTAPIVTKVWSFCNTLRDDGVSYGDYLEQLTYLMFLKMADEYSKPPYNRNVGIPAAYTWPSLKVKRGADLEGFYIELLRELGKRNLIYSEDNPYQYRFRDIIDLDSGKHLFTVEHEVRSATHPMFLRPLINRDPAQNNRNYAHGYEQAAWAMEPDEYDKR